MISYASYGAGSRRMSLVVALRRCKNLNLYLIKYNVSIIGMYTGRSECGEDVPFRTSLRPGYFEYRPKASFCNFNISIAN